MRVGRPGPALSGRLLAARLALVWEALWPALWPALALSGIFLFITLGDLWRVMPAGLHAALLVLFVIALVAALRFALAGVAWPDARAAYRRLERANGLAHRPLSAQGDVLAGERWDPSSRALWDAHRARQRAIPAGLKVGWPRAGLLGRDPYALRVALLLGVFVATVAAAGHRAERLRAAFEVAGTPRPAAAVDAWITPPAFAGAAPIFLTGRHRGRRTIAVPRGSRLTVRVHGAAGRPRLVVDGRGRALDAVDRDDWAFKAAIRRGRDFAVIDDSGPLARWRLAVIPDLPPKIAFDGTPRATPTAALRIAYRGSDAYGIAKLAATFRRAGSARVVTRALALSAPDAKAFKGVGFVDLTADPWAGLAVDARLVATDLAGTQGTSAAMTVTLPERTFRNPVARAVIALRRRLARDPAQRFEVAAGLAALAAEPDAYRNDSVVLLALTVAAAELRDDGSAAARDDVLGLLWNTALRLEDGAVSFAREALRRAERRLMSAMTGKAPAAEIRRRLQALQDALDRFLAAARQQAAAAGDLARPGVTPPGAQAVTPAALQDLMRRLRALSETGAQAAARQMLARLESLLERLQTGYAPPPPMSPEIGRLSNLMARQRRLLDRSFRALPEGPSGGRAAPPRESPESLAREQEAIAKALAALQQRLRQGGLPPLPPLAAAGRAMADARDALEAHGRRRALAGEGRALTGVGQGLQALWRELMAKSGPGKGVPGANSGPPMDTDPLGRPMPSFWDSGSTVKIPDHGALQRSHVILEELYRRLDDPALPPVERQYIERLLRFF